MYIPAINVNRQYYSFEDFSKVNELTLELINHLELNEFDYDEEKIQEVLDYVFGKGIYLTHTDEYIHIILTGHIDPSKRLEDLKDVFHHQLKRKVENLGGDYLLTEDDETDVFYEHFFEGGYKEYHLRSITLEGNILRFNYIDIESYNNDGDWKKGVGTYTMTAQYASVDRLDRIWKLLKDK